MTLRDPDKRREAHRIYMKEIWYPRNREIQKARVLQNKRNIRQFLADYKLAKGCMDCGYNSHSEVLDFDHVSGEKEFNLAKSWGRGLGKKRVLEEINKCEVVCANCHRLRTLRRRGGKETSPLS